MMVTVDIPQLFFFLSEALVETLLFHTWSDQQPSFNSNALIGIASLT